MNAFPYTYIHTYINVCVCMEQSQRFKSKTRLDYGCKLKKAVYGLKKSPRAWYDKIAEFLLQVGY